MRDSYGVYPDAKIGFEGLQSIQGARRGAEKINSKMRKKGVINFDKVERIAICELCASRRERSLSEEDEDFELHWYNYKLPSL